MSGGSITGNTANSPDQGGGGVFTGNNFTMTGGSIDGNSASNSGGGVFLRARSSFTMTGGSITGNTASKSGGVGQFTAGNPLVIVTFTFGGNAKITGNTENGAASNVMLDDNDKVELDTATPPQSGMCIGISYDGTLPAGGFTFMPAGADENIKDYFFMDDPEQYIAMENGKFVIEKREETGNISIDTAGKLTVGSYSYDENGNPEGSAPGLDTLGLDYSYIASNEKATLTIKNAPNGAGPVIKADGGSAISSAVDLEIKLETDASVICSSSGASAAIMAQNNDITISGRHQLTASCSVQNQAAISVKNLTVDAGTIVRASGDGDGILIVGALDNKGSIIAEGNSVGLEVRGSNVIIGKDSKLNLKGKGLAAYVGPEITAASGTVKALGDTKYYNEPKTSAAFDRNDNKYKVGSDIAQALLVSYSQTPTPPPALDPTPTPTPPPTPDPTPTPTPGPGYYYSTQTLSRNIRISGDSSASISVSVNGNTATVGEITMDILSSIIGSDRENTDITLNLSELNNIKSVVFTKTSLDNISKVLNDNAGNKTGFIIKLKDSSERFDAKAILAIVSQVEGKDLSFNISKTGDIISLSIVSNGKEISDFKGGIVTIGINNFSVGAGKKAENYHAYYKPKIGDPVRKPTWIKDGVLFFTTGHFSDYEIVYDENIKNGEAKHVYRLYNPGNGDHFFTVSKAERDACEKAGWIYEGIVFDVFNDGKKVYRLFNRATGEHFFTADQEEKDALVNAGWILEGAALISEGETEVYRLLNPGGMHMFTTSAKERDALVKAGWIYEGIGFKAN